MRSWSRGGQSRGWREACAVIGESAACSHFPLPARVEEFQHPHIYSLLLFTVCVCVHLNKESIPSFNRSIPRIHSGLLRVIGMDLKGAGGGRLTGADLARLHRTHLLLSYSEQGFSCLHNTLYYHHSAVYGGRKITPLCNLYNDSY